MAGENRKGSRSVGGSSARAINSWAASLAVDSARLSARIYAVTGDSGRSCRTVSNPHVEILPAGPRLFRRSSTPRRQAAHMRISLILLAGGLSVVAVQTYGIQENVAAICTPRRPRRGAPGGRSRFAQAVAPLIFRNQYSCMVRETVRIGNIPVMLSARLRRARRLSVFEPGRVVPAVPVT